MKQRDIALHETENGVKLTYTHNKKTYVGYHPIRGDVTNKIAYMRILLRLVVRITTNVRYLILHFSDEDDNDVRAITLHLQSLALAPPPMYAIGDSNVVTYTYGVFESRMEDSAFVGLIRNAVRMQYVNSREAENKNEFVKPIWNLGWIYALNAMNFCAFFDQHQQMIIWLRDMMRSRGYVLDSGKCGAEYINVNGRSVLYRFRMTFVENHDTEEMAPGDPVHIDPMDNRVLSYGRWY